MATLSLTLPISCQICLGKVKDPVICSNNHAFCTVCLDMWLQGNNCCPTCRVDITKEKPYRRVLGSGENTGEMSFQKRTQLRKTRLELLGREYETEIVNLSNEIGGLKKENKRVKEELDRRLPVTTSTANSVETLSNLTKKLQEISSTYDDVRRDMSRLQQEKDCLQQENDGLNREVARLREEEKFTKSPKRYEKFTIIGLKAKVDQYEKENEQLRKALTNRDEYVEELQSELKLIKSGETSEPTSQINVTDSGEVSQTETCTNSIVHQYSRPSCSYNKVSILGGSVEVENNRQTTPGGPRRTLLSQPTNEVFQTRPHEAVFNSPPNNGDHVQGDLLFPATKKLLELKKMHETRTLSSSSSPPAHTSIQRSPGPPWSPCLQLPPNYSDSSNTSGDETTAVQSNSHSPNLQTQATCTQTPEESSYSEDISGTLLQSIMSAPVNYEPPNPDSNVLSDSIATNRSPKRNILETNFMSKKIKIENP